MNIEPDLESSDSAKSHPALIIRKPYEATIRQAGVHRFNGIIAFEALRLNFGEAAAEQFLIVDDNLNDSRSCAAGVQRDKVQILR
ncbi:MAG: hypothetical protein ACR2KT_12010 [Methylocella sp.]